jgi:hypothetical protein
MFEEIKSCGHCNKEFDPKEPVVRWITSNILKFDFSDDKNFYYIQPFHYKCMVEIKNNNSFMKNLQDNDFEAGEFQIIVEHTKKHIKIHKNNQSIYIS